MTSKGNLVLESKDDMKKRGLKSPDQADAYVLTLGEFMFEAPEHILLPSIGGGVTMRLCRPPSNKRVIVSSIGGVAIRRN